MSSLLQAIVSASTVGGTGGPPSSINNFSWNGTLAEGQTIELIAYVNNWRGQTIYWEIMGGGTFPINPSTDISGASSGATTPGVSSGWVSLGNITFNSDSLTEGSETWGIYLGSTSGNSDYGFYGYYSLTDSSQGGPMPGGTGTSDTGSWSGTTYTLTPTVNSTPNVGTANAGDVITWTITSSPTDTSGRTMYWWVDNSTVPAGAFVENVDHGTVTLDGSGTGTFSLTVANPPAARNLFRMYVGMSLYQGFVTHGYIGV